MPVPSAPTTLAVVPSNDDGWLSATWVNVGSSLTGSKIEKTLDAGSTWSVEYDGALVATRKLYPIPGQVTGWRVYSKNASGYSPASSAVLGVTLGLHGWPMFPQSLVSTATPGNKVLSLGAGSPSSQVALQNVLARSKLALAGQVQPLYTYGVQRWRVASGTSCLLVPYNLQSGTHIKAADTANVMESLEGDILLWRDAVRLLALYCVVNAVKITPTANGIYTASFDLESSFVPVLPLTS